MKKRAILPAFLLLTIISLNLISAQASIGDFFDAFGGENLLLISILIISFTILNFIFGKTFKNQDGRPNVAVSGVVAFTASLLITYGIYRTNFDIEGLFFNIGVSNQLLYSIVPWIVAIGLGIMIWKLGKKTLLFVGIGLIILSLIPNLIYEDTLVLIVGIGLLVIYLIMLLKKPKYDRYGYPIKNRGGLGGKEVLIIIGLIFLALGFLGLGALGYGLGIVLILLALFQSKVAKMGPTVSQSANWARDKFKAQQEERERAYVQQRETPQEREEAERENERRKRTAETENRRRDEGEEREKLQNKRIQWVNSMKDSYISYAQRLFRKGLNYRKKAAILKVMGRILREVRKQGFDLNKFLSNKYRGTNMKYAKEYGNTLLEILERERINIENNLRNTERQLGSLSAKTRREAEKEIERLTKEHERIKKDEKSIQRVI